MPTDKKFHYLFNLILQNLIYFYQLEKSEYIYSPLLNIKTFKIYALFSQISKNNITAQSVQFYSHDNLILPTQFCHYQYQQ